MGSDPAATAQSAQLLARFAVLANADAETRAELALGAPVVHWGTGQTIFQRGDEGDRMLAITAGRVRISVMTASGRELVLKVLGPWQVLGEFAVLDGQPRSADATALEPTSAIAITRARFLQVAQRRPDLPLAFARYLCTLLRTTNFQMESIALYDVQSRLIRFIQMSVAQTYGASPPRLARIEFGLNQTNLAAALGATRPRVNNALQELLATGALRRDGAGFLCDLPRLAALAEAAEARL